MERRGDSLDPRSPSEAVNTFRMIRVRPDGEELRGSMGEALSRADASSDIGDMRVGRTDAMYDTPCAPGTNRTAYALFFLYCPLP